jgi:hypothetical protein
MQAIPAIDSSASARRAEWSDELNETAAQAAIVTLAPLRAAEGAFARCNEPITFGVSLPRGWCHAAEDLALTQAGGRVMPIQARTLDRWTDGSLRWALIDTFARTDGSGTASCLLTADNRQSRPAGPRISVTTAGKCLVVDTGVARFDLRPSGPSLFDGVWLGADAIIDADRSGLEITGADGHPYDVTFEQLSVVESGRLRAEIAARGTAAKRGRGHLPLTVNVRLQFFAESAIVRASLTLTNPNAARHPQGFWDLGDPGSVFLKAVRFTLAMRPAGKPAELRCSPEVSQPLQPMQQPFGLFQESSGGPNWASPAHRNRNGVVPVCFPGYRLVFPSAYRTGSRSTPIVSLQGDGATFSVAVPSFWQNFPKAIGVADDAVAIELFPGQHRDVHELQGGEQKTHGFVMVFGDDQVTTEPLAWARVPLVASVDGPRRDPHASGPASASDLAVGQYDELVGGAIDGEHAFERKREVADEYGWRNFGDLYADHEAVRHQGPERLISHYNNQYDALAGFATQYVRTGDRRWWSLMDDLAAHVVDVDLYHTDGDRPAYNHGYFWHTNHYLDAGTATHRAYPRRSGVHGGGPSAEHNYTTGLMMHYFLTGTPGSRDAVIQLADWVLAMDDGARTPFRWFDRGPTGHASATYSSDFHGPGRGAANSINALLDAHRLTNESRYLCKAKELVRRCINPADDLDAHNLRDPESRWSYVVFLQVLGKYLEHRFERGLVDLDYHYARASLLHYAEWMARHETPNLDRREKLEFPTETWAAQDIRKAAVFEFAAQHSADAAVRARFLERAGFFFTYAVSTLWSSPTRTLTRPMVLLLAYGFQSPSCLCPDAAEAKAEAPSYDYGPPVAFLAYKHRIKQKAMMYGALGAVPGLLLLGRLLWPL